MTCDHWLFGRVPKSGYDKLNRSSMLSNQDCEMISSDVLAEDRDFPPDFLFGAATASHQVEGDNRQNDWWQYEQSGELPFRSENACDHFNRFEEDFDLAKEWGHNCHRLSIEWSRIEPKQGVWDEEGLRHYEKVINALSERGIHAVVTLNHFTLPAWLQDSGGWCSKESTAYFARYVEKVVGRIGGSVKFWLTINEPTVYVQQAYINGVWPPQRKQDWSNSLRVLRNMARAHKLAYRTIKRIFPGAQISFAHSALHITPCDNSKVMDRLSAGIRDFMLNRLIYLLVGARPGAPSSLKRWVDFIGLNYYTRCCVTFGGYRLTGIIGRACKLDHHEDNGQRSDLGSETYPKGLSAELTRYSKYGLPILITENGVATSDDSIRCDFLRRHLRVVAESIATGVPVIGYLHWSLFDNFEWDHGTGPKYGLAAVEGSSLARLPRRSAAVYTDICRTGRIDGSTVGI